MKKVEGFKAFTKFKTTERTEVSSIYDFSVEANDVKMLEINNIKTFTFKVNRTIDNGLFENLLITQQVDSTYTAKLLQYTLTESEKTALLSGTAVDVNGKLNVINIDDPNLITDVMGKYDGESCYDNVFVFEEHPCATGLHAYGDSGCKLPIGQQAQSGSFVSAIISVPCDDGGGGGDLGTGVVTSPTGGGGAGSPSPYNLFFSSLLFNIQEWFYNQLEDLQANIVYYLNQNGYNTTSRNFVNEFMNEAYLNPLSMDDYVIASPNFKMRKSDQIKYPEFTKMLKNLKSNVQNNPIILNKLILYSGLTQNQVLEKLTFGQGPLIKFVPNLTGPSGPNYGNFDHDTPNIININANFALGMEVAQLDSTVQATGFLMAITILHEFVHYGNHLTDFDTNGNEMGNMFEIGSFGVLITKSNAGHFYTQFK
ncbi:hypothetical protein [Flavobacterium terrigena]|uniref:hypothetical protein n=1 Tax=Flavobacterium terrigena TaxID=402734 RepID=UPI0015A6AADC|nr:hypothetical protein [Flavobacterium terrigena]